MRRSIIVFTVIAALSILLAACAPAAATTAAPTTAPAAPTTAPVEPTQAPEATQTTQPTVAAATSSAIELPAVDPSTLSGDINTAGSSTVYPLAEVLADNFKKDGFAGNINLASVGTGGGFERFCKTGETDVSNASRAIKDTERAACAALNPARTPIEFRIGTDAIAVVVSKDNTFVTNLTLEQLAAIFTTSEKWSDVDPSWPAEAIQRFTPGTDSGTFDFFNEFAIQKGLNLATVDDAKKLALEAKNLQTSEDDNVLVQGVEGSPYAIGYFGYAYFNEQSDRLTAVSINAVAPSFDTAESGEYALSRPLFIYSDANILKEKPQVAGYINYFLTNVDDVITEVGYFPASVDALNAAKQAWLDAVK
ncbi:phosphate ABC transporter substrate-binding protein, PhoT family [Longilinea arvoryzae]|uniref:Phosphate-binding protein n=1 Tax=Longilinea arvoryzae TaxID=360412 RepID=A0A0S7BHS3_9CHLR|nr:PstS family phosphate ABC transporter substrate-binding protein [Longilinea arvoryzae]GAP15245.1 phosphate ABC transporter substrate-binding protein, PhoT family [Longilinea arvoryzae]